MYNPMLDYQRNQLLAQQAMIQNQLNQMQGQQFTPYVQQQPQQPQFVVRQVGNVEEAKGFPIDPLSTFLFVDTGSGHIYLKRLNTSNGKSDFFTYGVVEDVPQVDPMGQINERLTNIEKLIGGMYDKSVSSNGDVAESDGSHPEPNVGENAGAESADVSAGTADGKRKK